MEVSIDEGVSITKRVDFGRPSSAAIGSRGGSGFVGCVRGLRLNGLSTGMNRLSSEGDVRPDACPA